MTLSEISLDCVGCLLDRKRDGHRAVELVLVAELVNLSEELVESREIVVADLERGVDVKIGHVVIRRDDSGDEAEERLSVADSVLIGVDQTRGVLYVIGELRALLDADDRTGALFGSGVDELDELLCLAGALDAYY